MASTRDTKTSSASEQQADAPEQGEPDGARQQGLAAASAARVQFRELTGISPTAEREKFADWEIAHGFPPSGIVTPQKLALARQEAAQKKSDPAAAAKEADADQAADAPKDEKKEDKNAEAGDQEQMRKATQGLFKPFEAFANGEENAGSLKMLSACLELMITASKMNPKLEGNLAGVIAKLAKKVYNEWLKSEGKNPSAADVYACLDKNTYRLGNYLAPELAAEIVDKLTTLRTGLQKKGDDWDAHKDWGTDILVKQAERQSGGK